MTKDKKNEGITLIALIVTIVILLILSGIVIMQLNNNGLLKNTKIAKEKYTNSQKGENSVIDEYSNQIDSYGVAGNGRDTVTISREEYENLFKYKILGTYNVGQKIDISNLNFNEIFIEVKCKNCNMEISTLILKNQLLDTDKVVFFGYSTILTVIDGHKARLVMNKNMINITNVYFTSGTNRISDTHNYEITCYYR